MSMTDVKARTAKAKEKPYKLSDGDGLYLLVTPAGGKCWRFKYRFGGKEKLLAFGTYLKKRAVPVSPQSVCIAF